MKFGGRVRRGQSLTSMARTFHGTRHVHELEWQGWHMAWAHFSQKTEESGQGDGIYRQNFHPDFFLKPGLIAYPLVPVRASNRD